MKTLKTIFTWRWMLMLVAAVAMSATFTACGDDDDDEPGSNGNHSHDSSLEGEWVSYTGSADLYEYIYFDSDGTGSKGWYESDIDYIDETEYFDWYTSGDYVYIDGVKYEYWCDGSELELTSRRGKTTTYYEL